MRSPVTFSSFSCRPCGVALAHSNVLRLRMRKLGRGGVRWAEGECRSFALIGLPFASSIAPSVAPALLKSVELRECSSVLCSRNATILAGDLRACGMASSSIVLVRRRVDEACSSEILRTEMETTLRTLRFCHLLREPCDMSPRIAWAYRRQQPCSVTAAGAGGIARWVGGRG